MSVNRKKAWPLELDYFSEKIGQSVDLVQGPGGNTSWKDGIHMWVKASGTRLINAMTSEIFCKVNLEDPSKNLLSDGMRPSIESSLHAIVPHPYVIHVHSVASMAIGFRRELSLETTEYLESYNLGLLDYHRPGESLAQSIIKFKETRSLGRGLVLRNHGIVLWGNRMEELFDLLVKLEAELMNLFPIIPEKLLEIREINLEKYLNNRFLTPDHAVFGPLMQSGGKNGSANWLNHLRISLEKAVATIPKLSMVRFLENDEVYSLQNWDAEKIRQGMNL